MTIGEMVKNLAEEVERRDTLDRINAETRLACRLAVLVDLRYAMQQLLEFDNVSRALDALGRVQVALENDSV